MPMDTIQFSRTSVYIVRHAQTEENKQKIIQGHLDTMLNSEGERQADLVAKALKDIPFDVCYSSHLQRATDTAKRILVHHSGVELQMHIAVQERVRRSCVILSQVLSDGPNSIWVTCKVTSGRETEGKS
jgi:broad specificity phosphatase PhoE